MEEISFALHVKENTRDINALAESIGSIHWLPIIG